VSRDFPFWHSRPLDRVVPPWLANLCLPAPQPMEPGTCHTDLSVGNMVGGARDGCKRMIQRLDEENGHQENTVLSTWR